MKTELPSTERFYKNLTMQKLENLGVAFSICTAEQHKLVCKELERRFNSVDINDLFDHHAKEFKGLPSCKNQFELQAIITFLQHVWLKKLLKIGEKTLT